MSYLSVVSWPFVPVRVAGFGSVPLGEFLQQVWVRVCLAVIAGFAWAMHLLEASYAYSVVSGVPTLKPHTWKWTLQTLALGWPSLSLLQAEATSYDKLTKGRTSWTILESMTVKPKAVHQTHGHGITPGTCRFKVEHFVEAPKLQLVILLLVLIDIVAVVFEVIVSVNIVEFVDEELGLAIETALHFTCESSPNPHAQSTEFLPNSCRVFWSILQVGHHSVHLLG